MKKLALLTVLAFLVILNGLSQEKEVQPFGKGLHVRTNPLKAEQTAIQGRDYHAKVNDYELAREKDRANKKLAKGDNSFVTESDSLALVKLYKETNGEKWYSSDNWLTGPVHSWYGIKVNNGRVVGINLENNNLYGILPKEIGNLTGLDTLNVWSNFLKGDIPAEIGNLVNLIYLDLEYNSFSGGIPTTVGGLSKLTDIYLKGNNLSGGIPDELGGLSQLKYLYLDNNSLSGVVPNTIANLTNLVAFCIGNNHVTGEIPNSFTNLTKLQYLNVEYNDFEQLPNLSALPALNNFYAAGNRFTFEDIEPNIAILSNYSPQAKVGSVQVFTPVEGSSVTLEVNVGGSSNIYQWYKDGNPVAGATNPTYTISSYSSSTHAGIYYCKITNGIASALTLQSYEYYVGIEPETFTITAETLPENAGNVSGAGVYYKGQICTLAVLPNQQFDFVEWFRNENYESSSPIISFEVLKDENFKAKFSYTGSASIADSLALIALYNSTNGNGWNLPWNTSKQVSSWEGVLLNGEGRVYWLSLVSNNLDGTIPPEIGNLTELKHLDLSDNSIKGNIPPEIGNLSNLKNLSINYNQFEGKIPKTIGNLNSLQTLNLESNQLSGEIPREIGSMSNLQSINLSLNQLTGVIPAEIGNLNSLTELYFKVNQLVGSIPSEIGNLSSLTTLDLSYNQLSGSIPVSLGNMSTLEYLYLNNNQLTGTIPNEFSNLTALKRLYLQKNHLQGVVPLGLTTLSTLRYLYLNDNELTDLPDFSSPLYDLQIKNNRLTFEDIEHNTDIPSFIYSPQARFGYVQEFNPAEGGSLTLEATVGGTANTYQWYKDGNPIAGATSSTYNIPAYNSTNDAGTYMCKVSNTIATNLTLESFEYYVGISAPSYQVSVNITPVAAGNIDGAGSYKYGSTCTLTVTPENGYSFNGWYINDLLVFAEPSYNFTVTGDLTVEARFTLKEYEIAANANPAEGGTVTGAGTYSHGSECTLNATPATGYNFDGWYEGESKVSAEVTYTFTVTGARSLDAMFSLKTYEIAVTVNPVAGGTVTGGGTYTHGSSCTLTATPAGGYNFDGWYEDNVRVETNPSFTFVVTSNRNLEVRFTSTSGIDDGVETGLSVYPNPTSDFINIILNTSNDSYTIDVVNIVGQVVKSLKVSMVRCAKIGLIGLPSGYYQVLLRKEEVVCKTFKVIKQ